MSLIEQTNRKKGKLFIISAPSGAGKTTLCKRLLKKFSNLESSISFTTRAKRPNEVHGVDYFFTDTANIEKMIATGEFLEWAIVHGNYYGTSAAQIERYLAKGSNVLLDIDPQGAVQVQEHFSGNTICIFIITPTFDELKKRLVGRNTETDDIIQERLKIAKLELTYIDKYDYLVINDDIETASDDLYAIYRAEGLRITK